MQHLPTCQLTISQRWTPIESSLSVATIWEMVDKLYRTHKPSGEAFKIMLYYNYNKLFNRLGEIHTSLRLFHWDNYTIHYENIITCFGFHGSLTSDQDKISLIAPFYPWQRIFWYNTTKVVHITHKQMTQ